jgi:hypothetical protein
MPKWTPSGVIAVLSVCVTIGIQVQIVKSLQEQIVELKKESVPREVYNINQKNLTDAIDRLTITLDRQNESLSRLYAIEKDTGEPARVQGNASRGAYGK